MYCYRLQLHLDKLADDAVAAEVSDFSGAMHTIKQVLGYMSDSFISKDTLLSSSGLIPIYYWFYRTYGKEYKGEIRSFLLQFENKRKESRKTKFKDLDYVNFDRLVRSSNDQASLQGCYNILNRKWGEWRRDGKLPE